MSSSTERAILGLTVPDQPPPASKLPSVIGLGLAAFISLIGSAVGCGACGGVSMAAAPEATFGAVGPLVCHGDERISYRETRASYHRPGEGTPHVECVGRTGQRRDAT